LRTLRAPGATRATCNTGRPSCKARPAASVRGRARERRARSDERRATKANPREERHSNKAADSQRARAPRGPPSCRVRYTDARRGGRRARAGGQEEETTDAHQRPTSPCCSTAAVRTTRPLDPHAPAPAQRWCHPSRCALDEGSLRGATREEKTRHDEAADPRNTTRLFTTVKMYYLDDRPTSERQRADRTPRKRRAAPERAREHVFLPAAVRGRVARRKDDEGRSLHLPRDDSANECGGSGRRVSGRATSGRLDRSRTQNKHERTGSSGRSTSKSDSRRLGWKTFVWARRSDRVSWV
jgi:hypothetical protein